MSIKIKNTKAYMKNYAKRLIKLLKIELDRERQDRSKITYTGASKKSLKNIITKETLNALNIDIVGNKYLMDIEKGRKKTVQVHDIAKWLVKKPIAYANQSPELPEVKKIAETIASKIKIKGIKRLPFIKEAVKEDMKNLKVIAPIVEDIELSINEILIKAGFDMNDKTVKFV
tara:strand:- start:949 stop:1467 length:519 start_codon:yes stop_codon:yes gene_type:complete